MRSPDRAIVLPGDTGRPLVVLDTNVLVAAIRSRRGASFRVLEQVGTGVFDVVVSVPLLPSSLDHYKCYQAKPSQGAPKVVKQTVTIQDAFETKVTVVSKPVALCTPVAVNGGSVINPGTLLTCYQVKDASGQAAFARPALVASSLLGTESLATVKAETFCVPSQRLPGP